MEHMVREPREKLILNAKVIFVACLLLSFVFGISFARLSAGAFQKYFGVSLSTFVKSPLAPLAHWRVQGRDGGSSKTLQYTQDDGGGYPRRYVETALLPLAIEGARLSESYPVPKGGGAITVVGTTVIILDRLGGLYRYDLTTRSFGLLPGVPKLPNNLEAYLVHGPGPSVNIAEETHNEFRARDITFLPDRKELAVAYDKFDEVVGKLRTIVSLIPFDVTTLVATGPWREVFASDAFGVDDGGLAGAGRLASRGDNKIYVTIGDHDIDPAPSEDPNTTLGKTIEIDLTTNNWRLFTKGNRNQEGLTFLRSGQLFSTEHGPRGGDELNVITEGADYGWPNVTLGTDYNAYDWHVSTSSAGSHVGYKSPLFAWVPSVATTQLIEVQNFSPRWDGDLLVGSLKAGSLYRVRLEAGHVLYSEPIWIGERIRDIVQYDKTIILWTDDTKLLFVTVDQDQLTVNRRTPDVIGSALANNVCLGCHHFGPTNPTQFAPSLSNLLNRPIASDAFPYTDGLRAKRKLGPWTPALLTEFLSNTFKFAPGTTMPPLNINTEDIKDIVDALVEASDGSAGDSHKQSVTRHKDEAPSELIR
jgi:cytochrome c2